MLRCNFLFTLSLAFLLNAQDEPDPKQLAAIEGRAVDSLSGTPLRRVKLTLRLIPTAATTAAAPVMPPSIAAETADDGTFRIDKLDPGTYMLNAERQGYVRATYTTSPKLTGSTPIRLSEGQEMKELLFKLIPQAVLTGRVLDEEGEPVAGVPIALVRSMETPEGQRLMPATTSTSNDQGEFRLAGIGPGRFFLQAMPRNMQAMMGELPARQASGERLATPVPTFYPGVLDMASSQPFNFVAGQTISNVDLPLKKALTYSARGKVIPPSRDVRLMVYPAESGTLYFQQPMMVPMRPDGSFSAGALQAGRYHFILMATMGGSRIVGRIPVTVDKEDIEGLELTPSPLPPLNGRIKIEGDLTSYNQSQPKPLDFSAFRLQLMPAAQSPFGFANASVNEEGEFTIATPSYENYRPMIFPTPQNMYLKSIKTGTTEILGKTLDLTNGVPESLEFTFAIGTGTLSGNLTNESGNPAQGGILAVAAEPFSPGMSERNRTARSDQSGRYELRNLPPGSYLAIAFDPDQGFNIFTATNWEKYSSRAKRIQVEPNSTPTLDLQLTPVEAP